MKVCDRCKNLEHGGYGIQTYTCGLHYKGEPCEGVNASFEIDLCSNCKNTLIEKYILNKQWQELKNEKGTK